MRKQPPNGSRRPDPTADLAAPDRPPKSKPFLWVAGGGRRFSSLPATGSRNTDARRPTSRRPLFRTTGKNRLGLGLIHAWLGLAKIAGINLTTCAAATAAHIYRYVHRQSEQLVFFQAALFSSKKNFYSIHHIKF